MVSECQKYAFFARSTLSEFVMNNHIFFVNCRQNSLQINILAQSSKRSVRMESICQETWSIKKIEKGEFNELQGHWWGFISRNYVVWPSFLLMNVFIAFKGDHFWFLFDFTAAGVVPCGGRKTSPRTSTIVQFILYFGPLRSAIIFWEIRNKWLV